MAFRKSLGKTFPFSGNTFPAFRLARKLLRVVGGVLCRLRRGQRQCCTTVQYARRPTPDASTSPHILNGEHQMRMRPGLVLLKTGKQQLTRRLAPHIARSRHGDLYL